MKKPAFLEKIFKNKKEVKENKVKRVFESCKNIIKKIPFQNKYIQAITKVLTTILVIIILFLVFYRITEFKPKKTEKVSVTGEGFYSLNRGDSFTIMTWNIGHAALGDDADYFLENGEMIHTADRSRINYNLNGIRSKIDSVKPSIILMQEIDQNSKRVNHVDEVSSLKNHLNSYSIAYAINHKVFYLAYPLKERMGKINSGIATFSKYTIDSAKRIQLSSPNLWPTSMIKEKRCLLVTYIPIQDTKKKLVIINVQFDKAKQEKQVKELKELMEKEEKKGNYIIVGGDFQQTFEEIDTKKYKVQKDMWKPETISKKTFSKKWAIQMDNETPSRRSLSKPYEKEEKEKFQYYVVDGYIVSKNLVIEDIHTEDDGFEYSYHNPVIMKVKIESDEVSEE